jgi:DNA-binding MarR family transcriptional regulator
MNNSSMNHFDKLEAVMQRALGLGVPVDEDQIKIILLNKYNARLQKRLLEKVLHGFQLSEPEYLTLMVVAGSPEGRTTPSEIGELIGESRTNVTRICNVLCEKSLIQREVSPTNRRMVDITLSEKGLATLTEVVNHASRIRNDIFKRIPQDLKPQIIAQLLQTKKFLEDTLEGM